MFPGDSSRPRARIGSIAVALLLGLTLGGCSGGRAVDNPFDRTVRQDQVSLRVQNNNIHDATIFVQTGNERRELGIVSARSVRFLNFPWSPGTTVNLEIELSVGERYRLPPHPFTGGHRLELTVESVLRQSFITG